MTVAKGNDILAMDVSSLPVTATDISKGTGTDKDLSNVLQFVLHDKCFVSSRNLQTILKETHRVRLSGRLFAVGSTHTFASQNA